MEDFRMARLKAVSRSSQMASTVQELGAALARQAETAGERLQNLASQFREALPTNGAAALVSEGLESAKSYLGERDLGDFRQDVVQLVRRHPVQALLIGAGLGYAFEDEPVERAMETMKKHKIRRLPVLDREKRLMGIVSLGDLAIESDTGAAGHVLERVSAASPTH